MTWRSGSISQVLRATSLTVDWVTTPRGCTPLESGSAVGWGNYDGSSLTFSHQPASGYFGFQLGEGANNKNGNYGFSQWMYYTGTFMGDAVSGSGDIFGDLDCCLPYDLERSTWLRIAQATKPHLTTQLTRPVKTVRKATMATSATNKKMQC